MSKKSKKLIRSGVSQPDAVAGLAIVALSAIVGLVLRNMGHGAKEN